MLTHVTLRSDAFPAYETEDEVINPGRFGKRLAECLVEGLSREGESVGEIIPEDWGWVVPLANPMFSLWIGVSNDEEHADGFLCFIEPHREQVRRFFKKIPTRDRVEQLQARLDSVLRGHASIRSIQWWTHDDFENRE